MESDLNLLVTTAASIGLLHTLLGPDHYLPFVAMAQAREWSRARMVWITVLCGIGHVVGSVLIGLLGVWLGWQIGSMERFESARGAWAAWGLIAFGLAYGVWGVRRALRNRPHSHRHTHADGTVHDHGHTHHDGHAHPHPTAGGSGARSITPWALFTIFVLGPCEPLIPLLMVPAARHSWWGLGMVTLVFGIVTITTMVVVAVALLHGARMFRLPTLERWSHALAGLALFACGGAMQWLGL